MLALDLLAEQRIAEALARGEFDDLPGQGRPLDLDDDALIPEDVRAAFRILKNAGFVPPEVETLRAIAELERMIDRTENAEQRRVAVLKLDLLRSQLDRPHPGRSASEAQRRYKDRMIARFGTAR